MILSQVTKGLCFIADDKVYEKTSNKNCGVCKNMYTGKEETLSINIDVEIVPREEINLISEEEYKSIPAAKLEPMDDPKVEFTEEMEMLPPESFKKETKKKKKNPFTGKEDDAS